MNILQIMPLNMVNQAPNQCQWKIAHNKLLAISLEKCLLALG